MDPQPIPELPGQPDETALSAPGDSATTAGADFRVILYNDEWHAIDEVVDQIVKATGHSFEQCVHIMLEAHHRGRAVCYRGTRSECQRVAGVLREIRLQCEVDCD